MRLRHREGMVSVEEALERVLGFFSPLEPEERPLLDALGQVLAQDVVSPLDLPPLANSAMDGYAVRQEDIRGAGQDSPVTLRVIGQLAAGELPGVEVRPGTAIRIMTGAPIPPGADTVVPFEETDEVGRREAGLGLEEIGILRALPRGENIRPAGEDVKKGDVVLKRGSILRPAEVGVLASLGLTSVRVIRRPVVAVLSTGDELLAPGEPYQPGRPYDCNSFSIAALVQRYGGIPMPLGIARDNIRDIEERLERALAADFIITSAGVSKGDYDIVKDVLVRRGEIAFWSVRMRPGKPLAFGTLRAPGGRRVPHLGLPGNPVSAMVAFEQFARPAILKMQGRERLAKPCVEAVLEGAIPNPDGRRVYARVVVTRREGVYYAHPTGPQGSHILTSMAKANGLAICPEEVPLVEPGQVVKVQMLDWSEEIEV